MHQKKIEVDRIQSEILNIEVQATQSVYISNVKDSQIAIKGKCIKIFIIDVKNTCILIESVISNVEIMRANGSTVALGAGKMINVEQSTECKLGICESECEIRLRRNSCISAVYIPEVDIGRKTTSEVEAIIGTKKGVFFPEEIRSVLTEGNAEHSLVLE